MPGAAVLVGCSSDHHAACDESGIAAISLEIIDAQGGPAPCAKGTVHLTVVDVDKDRITQGAVACAPVPFYASDSEYVLVANAKGYRPATLVVHDLDCSKKQTLTLKMEADR